MGSKGRTFPFLNYHVAEQVVFGQQIGWINADVVENPEKMGFLKENGRPPLPVCAIFL